MHLFHPWSRLHPCHPWNRTGRLTPSVRSGRSLLWHRSDRQGLEREQLQRLGSPPSASHKRLTPAQPVPPKKMIEYFIRIPFGKLPDSARVGNLSITGSHVPKLHRQSPEVGSLAHKRPRESVRDGNGRAAPPANAHSSKQHSGEKKHRHFQAGLEERRCFGHFPCTVQTDISNRHRSTHTRALTDID